MSPSVTSRFLTNLCAGKSPGIWKNCSNARPCEQFLLANAPPPIPSMMIKCPALSQSDQYTKLVLAIFIKHNCFSSIELHKTSYKMSHSDCKKDKGNGFIAFIGLLWSINALHLLQNDSAWLLETLDSERCRKWRQDVTKQVFCCLQMTGGPGHY